MADIYDSRLKDRPRAIETYGAVLAADSGHRGALTALARLNQDEGNHAEASTALAGLLELSEGEEKIELAGTLATTYEALGQDEQACATLSRALEVDNRHEEPLKRLRGLYEKSEAWVELSGLIVDDANVAESDDDKVKLFREAAAIHSEKRDDKGSAAELLEKASALKPDDRAILLELCDAYSASGRGASAVEVLVKIVESYGGKRSKELGGIHRRLAAAYKGDGALDRALEELDKAFRIEPGNVSALKELGEVALEVGDLKKAQQMFRALLLQKLDAKSPITKAEVFFRLGTVHYRMEEKPKAIQMLERSIQTDKTLEGPAELLAEIKG